MMHHIIYKTTNVVTGKFYIGMHSTDDLHDGYLGSGLRLRRSVEKYGKENHVVEVLHTAETRDALAELEKAIVNAELLKDPLCMNLKEGGKGGWTKDSCRNGGLAMKGCKLTDEHKSKIGNAHRGKSVSTKTREKLSIAGKGKKLSEERKQRISSSGKGKLKPANCKIVIVNGIEYRSLRDAATTLGLNHHITLRRMIDSKDPKHNGIYYKDNPKE